MTRINLDTNKVASQSQTLLAQIQTAFGMTPNMFKALLEGGDERETGLPAAGGRLRLALTECAAEPAAKVRITAQTVVVASGGARGVIGRAHV